MSPIMVNSSQSDQDSLGLVDSGADTSMIGPEFYIEVQHDHRRVSIDSSGGLTTFSQFCLMMTMVKQKGWTVRATS